MASGFVVADVALTVQSRVVMLDAMYNAFDINSTHLSSFFFACASPKHRHRSAVSRGLHHAAR